MKLIETIENLCNESEENAVTILAKIKTAIQNERVPNFSKIKDGEHFIYHNIEFIRLGLEQGGVLCMTAKPFEEAPFDANGCNDWRKSSSREKLNTMFLSLLNENDLLPFESDLIADNGDTSYGKSVDKIGLLSCDLYRKYRKHVPLFDEWMWTCTPWFCKGTPHSWGASHVRLVNSGGTLSGRNAFISHALAPACIFRNQ